MKISVVMIVKNEEALLERCLQSVKDADELIIVDTGSDDRTVEIAKRFTDKVYTDFTWCDDFAKARNHAKAKATGDWILSIDADETLADFGKVRDAVVKYELQVAVNVTLISNPGGARHLFPRLFRNVSEVWWEGAVHNRLNVDTDVVCDVEITYQHSPAHLRDPNRTIRILEREVQKPNALREMYYLGREYLHYKRYPECIDILKKYVERSVFLSEKADAFLLISQAAWALGDGDSARNACLQAININANFKEALLWMGAISWDINAERWYQMAKLADNRGVLFVRTK